MATYTISTHERIDYKRCQRKWALTWRLGLTPAIPTLSALDLGRWIHYAFEQWYANVGLKRNGELLAHYSHITDAEIHNWSVTHPDIDIADTFDEMYALGYAMLEGYTTHYGDDLDVYVLGVELPTVFTFPTLDPNSSAVIHHLLKPDMLYRSSTGQTRLMEHKSAAAIRTQHLAIDDQARAYLAMAEAATRKAVGNVRLKGITYNYLRKAYPDTRQTDDAGRYLNQDGTVSKRQPPAYVERVQLPTIRAGNSVVLKHLQFEVNTIASVTALLRHKEITWDLLTRTPHWSCPKMCPFFAVCDAECMGSDMREQLRKFARRDPYQHYSASTEEIASFETG